MFSVFPQLHKVILSEAIKFTLRVTPNRLMSASSYNPKCVFCKIIARELPAKILLEVRICLSNNAII